MNMFKTDLISCKPISSLDDLFQWPFECNNKNGCREYKIEKLSSLAINNEDATRKKILVCHDMRNNYLEDKFFQGSDEGATSYSFYHWSLIDMFIYFSHHFITIPPESWINAAHTNNCRMLGTIITEWTQGEAICRFLDEKNKIDQVVKKLCEITLYYGFDGWLVNIENKIENVENLKYFLQSLRESLHKINPKLYKIIWYDSVIETGELKWQNELNAKNKAFFDLCDTFFVNYTWKEDNLIASKINALERVDDVYVGVDVFGRNCMGGGGFNCNIAFEAIRKQGLNVALFAPGWLHECNDKKQFIENTEKFWNLLEDYVSNRQINCLPIITSFSHGCAKNFFVNGKQVTESNENGWFNLNLQNLMPYISSKSEYLEWHFEDAFYGGNCILVKPNSKNIKLFDLNVELKKNQIYFIDYVFKSEKDSELFQVALNYNQSCTLELNKENFQNEALEFNLKINSIDEIWQRRTYVLMVKQDSIKLTDICVSNNSNEAVRLGLLRFMESLKNNFVFSQPKTDYKTKIFVLSKQAYLCINLKWEKFDENYNYYNVFIDENYDLKNDHEIKLRLIGSTKVENFLICLKMKNQFELNPNAFSDEPKLNFNVYVQSVDKYLDNLNNNEIFKDDSVIKIKIAVKGLRSISDDQNNLKFFDEIIYDYETFE